MTKPALLVVDDDQETLRTITHDLHEAYGGRFRVLHSASSPAALHTLHSLKRRGETIALLFVDQHLPELSGLELLQEAKTLFPEAKRVLLTEQVDGEAAIRAINQVRLDYYLVKRWHPTIQELFPVLDDLLHDWERRVRPRVATVRVVGHRWSREAHELKDFLARNLVSYQWLDVETDSAARHLAESAGDEAALPLVLFQDGSYLAAPSAADLADRLGLHTHAMLPLYDLIIVGAGPAGLAAAVYGASEGLQTLLVEREAPGGQAGTSSRIENYLGFPSGLSGTDLAGRAVAQAQRFGVELLEPQEVVGLRLDGPYRIVQLADGSEINGRTLLVTTGVSYRALDVPGVARLTGAGIYYGAAITEALECSALPVYLVGGANSAGQGALYLANYARDVTLLVRGESLAASMSQYLIDRIMTTPNIHVRTRAQVVEAHGEAHLSALTLRDDATGTTQRVPTSALFIFIGAAPRLEWLGDLVERDDHGFILSGPRLLRDGQPPAGWPLPRDPLLLETSVPGIFVAGDVRAGSMKRVASSVGEGAMAVSLIHQYLSEMH